MNYEADDNISPANELLALEITRYHPRSVFEFGAGTGKNINLLWKYNPDMSGYGCDLSKINVQKAEKNGVFIEEGDEYLLQYYGNIDVVFTYSVLCHMTDISYVVEQMKKLCNKAVIIMETKDAMGEYYYPHDYESHGFVKTDIQYKSTDDGATYHIYKWDKPKDEK